MSLSLNTLSSAVRLALVGALRHACRRNANAGARR